MIELQTLSFKGVGRFVDQQEINLSAKANIVGINAENRNTGGSSGGAKSTIFKAIDWLYGVNEVPTTVLKSRYAKDMEVTGAHLWNGRPLTVTRSTKNGLSIEWVDEQGVSQSVSGNSALAEEKLDEILKIPRELFRLISHKRQDEGGFFLNLTPKDSFEFLMSALNLSEWQKRLDILGAKVSEEKAKFDAKKILTGLREEGVTAAQKTLLIKGQALETTQQNAAAAQTEDLAALELALKEYEQVSQALRLAYQKDLSEIKRPNRSDYVYVADAEKIGKIAALKNIITEKTSANNLKNEERTNKLVKIKEGESLLKAKLLQISQAKSKIKEIQSELLTIENKILKIEAGSCHTCGQHWADEKSSKELAALKDKKANLTSAMADQEAVASETGTDEKIAKLQDLAKQFGSPFVLDVAAEQAEQKSIEDQLNADRQAVEDSYTAALHEQIMKSDAVEKAFKAQDLVIKTKIDQTRDAINAATSRTNFLHTAVAVAQKELDTAKLAVQAAIEQVEKAKKEERDIQKQHDLAEEGRRAIKSYLMTVFEEALDEIGERASRILSQLPNMNTATIYFEPFKEVTSGPNKGKVKEEVTAILSVDGEAAVPIKSISGGERASVDLAVDLAVVDLVEEKGGIGTNYLILDEPCTGMDSVTKEQYIEILKNSGTKKKILIVDHSSEIKEMVDDTILVIREGLYSRIEEK
jgi:energy-coupling factor transporter ATP-binding protein EcfA2